MFIIKSWYIFKLERFVLRLVIRRGLIFKGFTWRVIFIEVVVRGYVRFTVVRIYSFLGSGSIGFIFGEVVIFFIFFLVIKVKSYIRILFDIIVYIRWENKIDWGCELSISSCRFIRCLSKRYYDFRFVFVRVMIGLLFWIMYL